MMKRNSVLTLLLLIYSGCVSAQNDRSRLTVNVYGPSLPDDVRHLAPPTGMLLKGHPVSISAVENLPDIPLNVVFVLDNGVHQQGVMPLALDYVTKIAMAIHNSHPTYTLVVAAKTPTIVSEVTNASDLPTALTDSTIRPVSKRDESGDLRAGVAKAINILESKQGGRVIVIVSDDDDNINGKALKALNAQAASAHVRCFSVLLAAMHDFFGTKARAAWGDHLRSLADFSGGAQYETHWQNRRSDPHVLKAVAERISRGSLISFALPPGLGLKPGTYTLKAQFGDTRRTVDTSPFIVAR